MRKLLEEQTDCYRLYHGAVEGCPGLTVDRYGTVSRHAGRWGLRALNEKLVTGVHAVGTIFPLAQPFFFFFWPSPQSSQGRDQEGWPEQASFHMQEIGGTEGGEVALLSVCSTYTSETLQVRWRA